MNAIIIGGNETVKTTIREQLNENFHVRIHHLDPDAILGDHDQAVLESADVILIDLTSKFLNSRLFVKEMKEFSPNAKILVLHIYRENELITPLFHAGASGYMLIDKIHSHLVHVIKRMTGGDEDIIAGID